MRVTVRGRESERVETERYAERETQINVCVTKTCKRDRVRKSV